MGKTEPRGHSGGGNNGATGGQGNSLVNAQTNNGRCKDLLRRLGHHLHVMRELSSLDRHLDPFLEEFEAVLEDGGAIRTNSTISRLLVKVEVEDWKGAAVNGVVDVDGSLIPGRDGDVWCVELDIDEGRIINWPEGTRADIFYKVCDGGEYWFLNSEGDKLASSRANYVYAAFLCHDSALYEDNNDDGHDDYIIMRVGPTGEIRDYCKPQHIDCLYWRILSYPYNA